MRPLEILGCIVVITIFIVAMILSPIYRFILISVATVMALVVIVTWFSSRLNILYEHWEYRSMLHLNVAERKLGLSGMTTIIDHNPYAIKSIGDGKVQTHTPHNQGGLKALSSGIGSPDDNFPKKIFLKDFRLSPHLDKMFLGLLGDGQMFYSDFTKWIHTVVIGTTGSGKSEFAHVILTQLLLSKDPIAVDLIDFASGTFVDYGLPFARNIEEAESVFEKWALEFERRRSLFAQTKLPNGLAVKDLVEYNRVADEPLPQAVLMMEEAGALYRDSDIIRGIMKDLLSQARKQGLHIFFMAQSAKAEHLPTDLRDLFQTKIQFQVNEKSLAGMLIPGIVPEDYHQPGLGIFYQGIEGKFKFQSPLVEEYRLKTRDQTNRDLGIDPVIIDLAEESNLTTDDEWPEFEGGTAEERLRGLANYLRESNQNPDSVAPVEIVKHLGISRNGRNYDLWKEIVKENGKL